MTLLRRGIVAFLLLKLANLAVNLVTFPVLRPGRRRRDAPVPRARSVSLLVPMRNEAHRLAQHLPGLLAQDVDEVILLDDCSEDATGELARRLTAAAARGRVVTGVAPPAGWRGKTWACSQLAAQARSQTLVFCDADVVLGAGAVDAVAAQLHAQQADLLSVFPRQVTESLGEHLIVPLVDDVLLCFLPFPLLRADAAPSAATANGSVLAFDRRAYDRIGGFASVRGELVEDVALARLARRRGLRLGLVLGGEVVQTRMYTGYRECVSGFARGLLPVTGGSRARLIVIAIGHLTAYTLPVLMCRRRSRWRLPVLLAVLERLGVEAKTGRRRWWQVVLMPMSPLAAVPVLTRALRDTQHWKGRHYPRSGSGARSDADLAP